MMVLERLKEFIDSQGITIASFEKAVGLSNSSFRKALQSGNGIGSDKLENILKVYPDLSSEWLLRGEGPMLRSEAAPSDMKLLELCKRLVEIFAEKEETIQELASAIKTLDKK